MTEVIIALVMYLIIAGVLIFLLDIGNLESAGIGALILIITSAIIVSVDYSIKTSDTEIWSGKIVSVKHKEEWDEWHPPREETYTETDSKGNKVTKTRTIPGYWEHHKATNEIKTSDQGSFSVYKTPDGKKLTDNFVNSTEELAKYYPVGQATASTHSFTNKVQSSYSIFKHKEIDLDDYPDIYEYPTDRTTYYSINRLLGDFKDKEAKSKMLDAINTKLNDTDNPNNTEKIKAYKQVNIILANFGDKPEEYGWALQDYWENGAKNDLVVTFGTDKNNKPTWCYVFSWSDVEILKTDIRELIMSKDNIDKEFENMLNEISDLTEKKFERREFAEFDYIQIELSLVSKVLMFIMLIFSLAFAAFKQI